MAAVAAGRSTVAEVVAEHVDRCREIHPAINALVQPRYDAALAEARRPPAAGPLAGVPVTVKECFAVRGLCTTLGIAARRGAIDTADSAIVSRLREAGAIVLGKGNVPQALFLHETDNPVWGRTVHPTAPDRGPGGSSGGDAALVAAGCVPLAIGNDLAGSVRQPAHSCGVVGFLPRAATVGRGGAFDTMPGLFGQRSRVGFLVRHVEDAAVALRALAPDGVGQGTGGGARRPPRVGWWDETGPIPPSPAVRRAVAEAVERLRAGGAIVERLDARVAAEAAWIHLAFLSADGARDIRALFGTEAPVEQVRRLLRIASLPRAVRRILAAACGWSGRGTEAAALRRTGPVAGRGLARLFARRAAIDAIVEGWRDRHDAIVCPVSALPALPHGTASRLVLAAAPCLLASLLDLAAGSVPVTAVREGETSGRGWSPDPILRLAGAVDRGSAGLPVGVQVVSLHRAAGPAERLLLEVMRMVETPLREPVSR